MWGDQTTLTMKGNFTAANDSKIAVYADGCEKWCAPTSVVAWQNVGGDLWFAGYLSGIGWWGHEAGTDQGNHTLLMGSSLSLMPIWANETGLLALYANTGNMSRFLFNTTDKWEEGWSYNGTVTFLIG